MAYQMSFQLNFCIFFLASLLNHYLISEGMLFLLLYSKYLSSNSEDQSSDLNVHLATLQTYVMSLNPQIPLYSSLFLQLNYLNLALLLSVLSQKKKPTYNHEYYFKIITSRVGEIILVLKHLPCMQLIPAQCLTPLGTALKVPTTVKVDWLSSICSAFILIPFIEPPVQLAENSQRGTLGCLSAA